MTSESVVPDGFVPYSEPSPFLDRIGPLYERDDANGFALGLLVLDQHCNRRGFAHGGLLVTLADITLGKTGERRSTPRARLLTTNLAFDFVDIARRGDRIEAQCDFQRTGREIELLCVAAIKPEKKEPPKHRVLVLMPIPATAIFKSGQ
jgi:acyl-coenzyme A thioesterase 13